MSTRRILSQSERDYVINELEDEMNSVSEEEYQSHKRTESSFMSWLRSIAYKLGRAVSAPFRAVFNVVESFLDGLFG